MHQMLVHGAYIEVFKPATQAFAFLQSLIGARDQCAEAQQVLTSPRMSL